VRPRDKRPSGADVVEAPPRELRQFGDWWLSGQGFGRDVYPDRAAWVAARAGWAEANGMTVVQWWDRLVEAAIGESETLEELNMPFGPGYFVDADEDDDPRLTG
jgi:hypothetical protein